jgi:hypothetical protein
MKSQRSSQIAQRSDDRNAGGHNALVDLNQFMFVVQVKAYVKSRWVLHCLALRQGAQSERKAVLVSAKNLIPQSLIQVSVEMPHGARGGAPCVCSFRQ